MRRRRRRRRLAAVLVAALAIAAAAAALILIVLPGRRADERSAQLQQITAGAARAISSLNEAAGDSRPEDAGSLVALRATARRSTENLGAARTRLRRLERKFGEAGQQTGKLKDALGAATVLARALGRSTLVASTVEGLTTRADKSALAADGFKLPTVNTQSLVTALEARDRAVLRARIRARTRARHERERAARQRRRRAAATPPEPSTNPVAPPAVRSHLGTGYRADLPSGPGWGAPVDSEPTPGRLFRTTVRGPGGMLLLIDYTPAEPAIFGGSFSSRREVGQTTFGSATEYVFQGGALPECQRVRCVDYLVNNRATGAGFGVLAGGPSFDLAQQVARSVMESLTVRAAG